LPDLSLGEVSFRKQPATGTSAAKAGIDSASGSPYMGEPLDIFYCVFLIIHFSKKLL
jgi:hypothetical protein